MGRGEPVPAAQSRYRGLRVTITSLPDGGATLVTVAAKGVGNRWDEWSLLYPAIRMGRIHADSAESALEAIHGAIQGLMAGG